MFRESTVPVGQPRTLKPAAIRSEQDGFQRIRPSVVRHAQLSNPSALVIANMPKQKDFFQFGAFETNLG
jgi:hypothetical protein